VTIGLGGLTAYTLPLPVFLAVVGAAAVIGGALLIRMTFHRREPVVQRGAPIGR
jgi:hypothetical protein